MTGGIGCWTARFIPWRCVAAGVRIVNGRTWPGAQHRWGGGGSLADVSSSSDEEGDGGPRLFAAHGRALPEKF